MCLVLTILSLVLITYCNKPHRNLDFLVSVLAIEALVSGSNLGELGVGTLYVAIAREILPHLAMWRWGALDQRRPLG